MISFKTFSEQHQSHKELGNIDENFLKRMFGFGKNPEERLEIARDSIRDDKAYMKKSGTGKFFDQLGRVFGARTTIRGGSNQLRMGKGNMMDTPRAYEYVYVWGTPEEKREAEAWLKNNRHPNNPISNLKNVWSHDSKLAALTFGSLKCCYTGPRGTIKV